MKINDLTGNIAEAMRELVNNTIVSMANDFTMNNFNVKLSRYPCIYTNKGLKQFFSKEGISAKMRSRNSWNMTSYVEIPDKMMFALCPDIIQNEKTFTKIYKGKHEFIEYSIEVNIYSKDDFNSNNYFACLSFSIKGYLSSASEKLGPISNLKKANQTFKDMNGVVINKGDEIVYIKNSVLCQSIVDGFDTDKIIADGKKIKARDWTNNSHIVVLNNKMNWMGMKI